MAKFKTINTRYILNTGIEFKPVKAITAEAPWDLPAGSEILYKGTLLIFKQTSNAGDADWYYVPILDKYVFAWAEWGTGVTIFAGLPYSKIWKSLNA